MLTALKVRDYKITYYNDKIQYLPVEIICPNPYQSRKFFDRISLEFLSESIKKYGVLQPIMVRFINNCSYEIVSGERRLKAAIMAGLKTIPVIIIRAKDYESSLISLIENLHQQKLNFFEEAQSYKNVLQDYKITEDELAKSIHKSQSYILNKLKLLNLREDVKDIIINSDIPEKYVQAIIKIPDFDVQLKIVEEIIENDLTLKQTQELVKETMKKIIERKLSKSSKFKLKRNIQDFRIITNSIKKSVDILRESGISAYYEEKYDIDAIEIKVRIKK